MDHILNRIKNKEQFWIAPHHVDELLLVLSQLRFCSGNHFSKFPCSHYNINYIPNHNRYPAVVSLNGKKQGTELTPSMLYNFPILSRRS